MAITRLLLSSVWWYVLGKPWLVAHRNGPKHEKDIQYPGLGHTARIPDLDSYLFLQRNSSCLVLDTVGGRRLRALAYDTSIRGDRTLEATRPFLNL